MSGDKKTRIPEVYTKPSYHGDPSVLNLKKSTGEGLDSEKEKQIKRSKMALTG